MGSKAPRDIVGIGLGEGFLSHKFQNSFFVDTVGNDCIRVPFGDDILVGSILHFDSCNPLSIESSGGDEMV